MEERNDPWDEAFRTALVAAKDYRAFLRLFFTGEESSFAHRRPKPISYAEFSRRARLSSRSYIRDFIEGDRVPGPVASRRICVGLNLQGPWRDYFEHLVKISSNPNESSNRQTLERLKIKIVKSKKRPHFAKPVLAKRISKALSQEIAAVFAASGTVDQGATIAEICSRTKLSPVIVEKASIRLMELGLFTTRNGRNYPVQIHLAAEKLGNESTFLNDFRRGINLNLERAEHQKVSSNALFFRSSVCVNSELAKEHAGRLRDILYAFVNEIEDANGDCLADLVVGFSNNQFDG
jgi:hypothetical protein